MRLGEKCRIREKGRVGGLRSIVMFVVYRLVGVGVSLEMKQMRNLS